MQSGKQLFAHFDHKWDRLFRRPMWGYDGETSEEEEVASSTGDPVTRHLKAGMPAVDLLCIHRQLTKQMV